MRKIYFQSELCDGCKACEQVCREKHSETQSLFNSKEETPLRKPRIHVTEVNDQYSLTVCQNCVHPLCVQACMAGALMFSELGNVIQDLEQCVGCFMCVMACPFGAIAPQEETGKAGKCQLCIDEEQPPCVVACEKKALIYCTSKEFEQMNEGEVI